MNDEFLKLAAIVLDKLASLEVETRESNQVITEAISCIINEVNSGQFSAVRTYIGAASMRQRDLGVAENDDSLDREIREFAEFS